MGGFGEVLARYENHVDLDPDVKDAWGVPVLRFHYQFGDNERKMCEDMVVAGREMFEAAGIEVVGTRSEEHTSELQSRLHLVCRLLLEKKKKKKVETKTRQHI